MSLIQGHTGLYSVHKVPACNTPAISLKSWALRALECTKLLEVLASH